MSVGKTSNLVLKRSFPVTFSKNGATQENIQILRMNEDYKTYTN